MPADRPIFIVGCPRSGTTMLQLMVHAHPRIAVPPETRFLLAAYQRRAVFGDLTEPARRHGLARYIVESAQFEDLGLNGDEVTAAIVAGPPTLGSACGIVYRMYSQRFGKPRWGDKRPLYLRHLPTILRLFPDAQIINIMRDGRDCVASLKETPWKPSEFDKLIDYWTKSADASLLAERRYPKDVYHQVRYEDLVADPEPHLRRVCEFLREDYDPAMSTPNKLAPVAVPEYKTWHTLTHRAPTTERVQSWRTRLSAEELRRCEEMFGDRLARFGYQPSAPVPRLTRMRSDARLIARHRLGPAKRAARELWRRIRSAEPAEPPVAALLTAGQLGARPVS
ncbi:sulfotransferase [Actinoplanes sp. NEAU-A12]|uniref:Sulfotransferase n=1 Tax=Actinoplanes sandaracinus TaxID=3045177 RepID=A0ABT6WK20_9ACTN|nr:sulfotransferase [Actinoplanes sandaracinus]MDI6100036.1 sulfotransferase [Actinoplanes sandaracinus]